MLEPIQFLPLPPSSRIHSQNPETVQRIDDSLTFFLRPVVVLSKLQPSLMYVRFGLLNQLYHLRPIGFEQGRVI